jgi:hypothetical protein
MAGIISEPLFDEFVKISSLCASMEDCDKCPSQLKCGEYDGIPSDFVFSKKES